MKPNDLTSLLRGAENVSYTKKKKNLLGLQMHVSKLPAVITDNYRILFNLILNKGLLPLHSCFRDSPDVESR